MIDIGPFSYNIVFLKLTRMDSKMKVTHELFSMGFIYDADASNLGKYFVMPGLRTTKRWFRKPVKDTQWYVVAVEISIDHDGDEGYYWGVKYNFDNKSEADETAAALNNAVAETRRQLNV